MTADNSRKTPLAFTLSAYTAQKSSDAITWQLGKTPPCHVTEVHSSGIVTVAYDVVGTNGPITFPSATLAVAMSAYDQLPIQVGDKGVAVAADYSLGSVTGLGGSTANLSRLANLATGFFVPLASKLWTPVGDLMVHYVSGPHGVVVQDDAGKYVLTVPSTGNLTIVVPVGVKVNISSGGTVQPVKLADNTNSVVLQAQ